MPAVTINPATFADVLGAVKTAMVANGNVGSADNIKMSDRVPTSPPTGFHGNELWVLAPGPHWVWEDGIEIADDSDLLLTGEVTITYWLRTTTDGELLADNLLTDAVLGNTTKVARLLSLFKAEATTGWLVSNDATYLIRPLQFKYLSFQPQPHGTPWRGVTMSYEAQFRAKTY